ncbi:MAG: DNA-3-methyladenine glycosylase [Bacteroidia bacterium]
MERLTALDETFFLRDVHQVAVELLGKILWTCQEGKWAAVQITEVEAYAGITDKACHAYGGRCTPRNQALYLEGGHAYVYLCYGIHYLFNVVTGRAGDACAVLVRSGQPFAGMDILQSRRKTSRLTPSLTTGPGNLTQALGIDKRFNGQNLISNPLIGIADGGIQPQEIFQAPRIGVAYAQEDALQPWRYFLPSPFVSKPHKGTPLLSSKNQNKPSEKQKNRNLIS